jgi:hypothetical protein
MLDLAYKIGSAIALQEEGEESPSIEAFQKAIEQLDEVPGEFHMDNVSASKDPKEPDIDRPIAWDSPTSLKEPVTI